MRSIKRRERRRLARPGRARDEHEAARLVAELVEALGQPELLERPDPRRDHPEGRADARALEVRVDAEAGDARQRVREVELALRSRALLLLGREDPVDQRAGCRRAGARRRPGSRSSCPLTRMTGGEPDREVEVGGVVLDHRRQELVDRKDRSRSCYFLFGVRRLRLERFLRDFVPRTPIGGARRRPRRTGCRRRRIELARAASSTERRLRGTAARRSSPRTRRRRG